jgi:hypothetical protein
MTPEEFAARWLPILSDGAWVRFEHGSPDPAAFIHSAMADGFVGSLGLKPIGYNWELLDPSGDKAAPRSAMGEITSALSYDLANPNRPWLPAEEARRCAGDFLALFDAATRTIVSNRHDGLWNPIAGHAVEWGFVGWDKHRIALLLLAAQ